MDLASNFPVNALKGPEVTISTYKRWQLEDDDPFPDDLEGALIKAIYDELGSGVPTNVKTIDAVPIRSPSFDITTKRLQRTKPKKQCERAFIRLCSLNGIITAIITMSNDQIWYATMFIVAATWTNWLDTHVSAAVRARRAPPANPHSSPCIRTYRSSGSL